jgi:UDP-N-acetylmuramate--L-alanine ligase/UDP-N-acetylenolpyruvoylglucosamine reductase
MTLDGRNFHMMGIGGAGVSALAQVASAWGADVSGCDRGESPYLDLVRDAGIPVAIGHDASHIVAGSELVVSSAIPQDHPELARARELNVPVMLRGALLAEITRAKRTIVVAGAHGKTTTTGMIAHILACCGLEPSAIVGAEIPVLGGNVVVGDGEWLVAEGDESDRTLGLLSAEVAVITNIERDHHHTFASDEAVEQLFRSWLDSLAHDATVIAPVGSSPAIDRVLDGVGQRVVDCGEADAETMQAIADVLPIPGYHNLLNALAACRAAEHVGVPFADAVRALRTFTGAKRRFEIVGRSDGITVVDDYAHHPTEVAVTVQAARTRTEGTDGRVVVVFQPHLYSRTQELGERFAESLAGADKVWLLPIYGAREDPIPGITSERIAAYIEQIAPGRLAGILDIDPATGDPSTIVDGIAEGDWLIAMGAGSVTELAPRIVDALEHGTRSAAADVPACVQRDAPLSKHTTIGTGGLARYLALPSDERELQQVLEWARSLELAIAPIGLGSNTLVADEGFDGVAIRLTGELSRIEILSDEAAVVCGGGASLAAIVRLCRDAGLSGFEFGCAIPGTVGGAVKMNAGAYGGEMVDVLASVRIVSADGVRTAQREQLELSYRHSNIAWSELVSEARLTLRHGDPVAIKETVRSMQTQRSESQPRAARSFGSVFRNPEPAPEIDGQSRGAGALIELAGLKGRTIGGACISPKHGNFIENLGGATTNDVLALIEMARSAVRDQFGVELVTEVHLLDRTGHRWLG